MNSPKISVVTPTLRRAKEVAELIGNLCQQTLIPYELILVDGAPENEKDTEEVIQNCRTTLPFVIRYIRHGGGTAIQRNVGIDVVSGDFIAFIDDDIRLESDFFERIIEVFKRDSEERVGGVIGYITNQYLDLNTSSRWKWYRRLKLFTTFEPGRYDYQSGYPINRYLQPPHDGIRCIDFMSTNCALWRKSVFVDGLRFSEFFVGFGVLEDAHFALKASKQWQLLEYGRARCIHLKSSSGRENVLLVSRKTAVNYRFVFIDIVPNRTWKQEFRFWRVQLFDFCRLLLASLLNPTKNNWLSTIGKAEGIVAAIFLHSDLR